MNFKCDSADVKLRADKVAVIALHSQNQIETLAGF
jgi:hypothetical protein